MHVMQQPSSKQGLIQLRPLPLRQKPPRNRVVGRREPRAEQLGEPPSALLLVMLEQVLPLELLQVLFAGGVSRKRRISRRSNRQHNRDKHSSNRRSTLSAERFHRALMRKDIR